ncbi:hypothetical protein SDC9_184277 [bioreactor metagenome]|uniref:Uncharacterized protein n=1 Tax=bioreactor metagenome TaxID=1076179 RepID=A0A645HE12_9ZZZZ
MVVIGDETDVAGGQRTDQFADQIAFRRAAGQKFLQDRMWQRKVLFRVGEGENTVPCSRFRQCVGKAFRIESRNGFSERKARTVRPDAVSGPVYADSETSPHPRDRG